MAFFNSKSFKFKVLVPVIVLTAFFAGWVSGVIAEGAITREMIAGAGKIIGLSFTEAKQDSLIDGLADQLKSYETMRKYKLTNDVSPAVQLNPIPVDYKIPSKQQPLVFSAPIVKNVPVNKEDLAYLSIIELSNLIKNKKITSLELTKFYLERLKKFNPKLECIITLTEELALKKAAEMDKELAAGKYRGYLHGIPFGLKDLFAVKGYPTTWGSMPYKDQVIDFNSTVYKKLDEAGAVLCAKLTLGELAMGEYWFGGMTRNPWNLMQGSSGSSAGSAASVSAGLLPFAIGTETWGSIVSPSTVCGVTGLRPTYGRISRIGAMALSWSMDKVGPICRNAEDCAIVFNALRGKDGVDKTLVEAAFNYSSKVTPAKLKVGYLNTYFERKYDLKANDSATIAQLKNIGFKLIPAELKPDVPVQALSIILMAEAGAAFDELTRGGGDDKMVKQGKDSWPCIFRAARFIPAVEYINANRLRSILIKNMNDLMKNYDVLVVPSLEDDIQLITNLTGHPSITMPNGFTKEGLPTSITFIGNLFDEGKILEAAHYYQSHSDNHLKRPGVK